MYVLPQSIDKAEPLDQHRPNCPKCSLGMWLFAQVTEHSARRRTYVCEVCGTTEVVRV
jgi:ribosomal protein S27AE